MTRYVVGVVAILVLAATWSAAAEDPEPLDAATSERVRAWIELLRGSDSDDHALATQRLLKVGSPARPILEAAVERTRDAEPKSRLQAVLTLLAKPAPPAPMPAPFESVEVHVVSVYCAHSSSQFSLMKPHQSGVQWVPFCEQLAREGEGDGPKFTQRLWSLLIPTAKLTAKNPEFLEAWGEIRPGRRQEKPGEKINEQVSYLARDLEAILARSDLHQPSDPLPAGLEADARALAKSNRELSPLERRYLNRRLFEAHFRDSIEPLDFTLARNTVDIRVGKTERPVVLIVSANDSVRWKIEAAKEARLVLVLVGGNDVQDVVGTNAPVEFYTRQGPRRRDLPEVSLHAPYAKDRPEMADFKQAVKKLLGREIASFQGSYEAKETFVVGK